MDFVKAPLLCAAGLFIQSGGFVSGICDALAQANIPHTPHDLGVALVPFVSGLFLQLWGMWQNRKSIDRKVLHALAYHLSINPAPTDASGIEQVADSVTDSVHGV